MQILKYLCLALLLVAPSYAFAHPGNTASDGMHYCRTNCDYWGVPWGERHGHGGSYSTYTSPAPYQSTYKSNSDCGTDTFAYLGTCYYLPSNSKKSILTGFTCNYGYEEVGYGLSKQCLKEVDNGYRIGSIIYCDYGYSLYGGSCLKESKGSGSGSYAYNQSSRYACPKNSSTSTTDSTKCTCDLGYTVNKAKDGCKKINKNQNNKVCRAEFGKNSLWSGEYNTAEGVPTCVCKKGFVWSNSGTSCRKD